MLASIAQGLHLSLDERDHLFRLAGHHPPRAGRGSEHISPGLLRILDRLARHPGRDRHRARRDAAADAAGVALTGDVTRYTGPGPQHRLPVVHRPRRPRRSTCPRTTRSSPACTPPACAGSSTLRGPGSRAAQLADLLLGRARSSGRCGTPTRSASDPHEVKRFKHPEVGVLELNCQTLLDPDQSHR